MKSVELSYPFIILCCIIYALDREGAASSTLAAIIVHELGHIVMILMSGGKVRGISAKGIGGAISFEYERISGGMEIAVFAAGPGFGAMAAMMGEMLGAHDFAMASAGLTVMNLLPAMPLDGGCVLKSILPYDKADKISCVVSALTGFVVSGLGLILIARNGNFSLFAVGITIFVCLIRENGIKYNH